MTKDQLIKRIKAHRKTANIWGIIWLISLFVSFFALIWFFEYFVSVEREYVIIFIILLVALFLGHFLFLFWLGKKRFKKYGLECPNCKKPIYASLAQIAVATGKCGECGATIIQENAEKTM